MGGRTGVGLTHVWLPPVMVLMITGHLGGNATKLIRNIGNVWVCNLQFNAFCWDESAYVFVCGNGQKS